MKKSAKLIFLTNIIIFSQSCRAFLPVDLQYKNIIACIEDADSYRRDLLTKDRKKLASVLLFLEKTHRVKREMVLKSIEGSSLNTKANAVFNSFSGNWQGKWKNQDVSHKWYSTVNYDVPRHASFNHFSLRYHSIQYVNMTNAYGWNVTAVPFPYRKDTVILGSVVHYKDNKENIQYTVPHVGVVTGESQLIWITPENLFIEKIEKDKYKIEQYKLFSKSEENDILKVYETKYNRSLKPENLK